jgi:DNA-binding transcriptional LysR family regulator
LFFKYLGFPSVHFNYNHLRVFREVMIQGSATRAALEVNITQSSVSRILKEFEESVGFRLFDRERTGLRPTREAQKLFKDVQRAYATFTDVKQTAQSILNNEEGQLRIAALAAYLDGFVSRNLSDFMAGYPGIRIQIIAAAKPEIEKLVATEQVDLGITTLPVTSDLITIRKSITRSAVCIFPKEHTLRKNKEITLSDLMAHQLIHQFVGAPLRSLIDMKFLEQGLEPTVRVEIESQRAIVNIVCTGGGIGVIDPDVLSDQDRDQICYRPLTPSLEWSLALVSAKRVTPMQIADAFLDWMDDLQP